MDKKIGDDLGANDLRILMSDTPQEAPTYRKPEYLFAKLQIARVVGRGTKLGNPTVDLIFEDDKGQKYVAMITGGLMENLAVAIKGIRDRTKIQDKGAH